MIVYTFAANPDADLPADYAGQITALYRSAGWWNEDTDNTALIKSLVFGSYCFLVALEDDRIVGMGRVLSDGVSDAYIQDVTVRTDCRHRGIGGQIIRRLIERLTHDSIRWIGLIAENNSHAFYQRLGFSIMPQAVPMLKTIDEA